MLKTQQQAIEQLKRVKIVPVLIFSFVSNQIVSP